MLNLCFKTLNDLYETSASETFVNNNYKNLNLLTFIFVLKDRNPNPFEILLAHIHFTNLHFDLVNTIFSTLH